MNSSIGSSDSAGGLASRSPDTEGYLGSEGKFAVTFGFTRGDASEDTGGFVPRWSTGRRLEALPVRVSGVVHLIDFPLDDAPPHSGPHIEVTVVCAGSGVHVSALGRTPAVPGSVFVMRPGAWFVFVDCHDMVMADLAISANALRSELSALRDDDATRRLLLSGPMGRTSFGTVSTRIPEELALEVATETGKYSRLRESRPDNRLALTGQVLATFGTLTDAARTGSKADPLHPAIVATLDAFETSPGADWSMPDVAGRVGLDPAYLSRLFHRQVGVPPLVYLTRLRAEQAAELLATTNLPTQEVGERIGMPDRPYFSRRMQSLLGSSPSVYRSLLAPRSVTETAGRDERPRIAEIDVAHTG